jgi:esterase/lipase superfamily enzyme
MTNNRYIICTRDQDANGKLGTEPGETQFLIVPPNQTSYSAANSVSKSNWKDAVISAASRPSPDIDTGMTGDILLFVHGYNNSLEEIVRRTDLLQTTLTDEGWRGQVVAFDWPCENNTLNYLEDRFDASAVAGRLVTEVLPMLVSAQAMRQPNGQPKCTINIHLLGHSTGAFVVMEAFSLAIKKGENYRSDFRIGQVGFIAADVSARSLDEDQKEPLFDRLTRLTNYSNGYDAVLAVSNAKRLGVSPRAGRVGLNAAHHPKAVNVDTTQYFETLDPHTAQYVGTFCHSWHIGDPLWARDFAMTLDGRIDRRYIPTRTQIDGDLALNCSSPSRPKQELNWLRSK